MSAEAEKAKDDDVFDLPINQLARIICSHLTADDDLDIPVTAMSAAEPGVLDVTLVDDLDRQHDFTITVAEGRST